MQTHHPGHAKPIVLEFTGGYWTGKSLRTDSADQEESLLAAACYEMTHHGSIGAQCVGLSEDAILYARLHGWDAATQAALQGDHRYRVTEYRETAQENIITLEYQPEER